MKIVQINVVYAQGSTGHIVEELHKAARRQGMASYVIYGRKKNPVPDAAVVKAAPEWVMKLQSLRAKVTGDSYGGCAISTARIIRCLEKWKPDVVHLHCLNGYFINIYKILEWLKGHQIPTVLTLHAEFMYTANCSHAYACTKWKRGCYPCGRRRDTRPPSWFFDRAGTNWRNMHRACMGSGNLFPVAVSGWLRGRAMQSPFYAGKDIAVIHNGVDTSIFRYRKSRMKETLGIHGKKLAIHVASDFKDPLKGGRFILEIAHRMGRRGVHFLLVGRNVPKNCPDYITALPYVSSQKELAEYYSAADVCLLASRAETFSMVCAESLCCGTPVAGFLAGGPESVALSAYSSFVPYGDVDALWKAAEDMLGRDFRRKEIEEAARACYSNMHMAGQYMALYRKTCGKQASEEELQEQKESLL